MIMMNDLLMFYEEKCTGKCLIAYIVAFVIGIASFEDAGFLGMLGFGVILGLILSITLMIWRPIKDLALTIGLPIAAIFGPFSFIGIAIAYFVALILPFALVCLGASALVEVNEYIFGGLFFILSILNLIACLYFTVYKKLIG